MIEIRDILSCIYRETLIDGLTFITFHEVTSSQCHNKTDESRRIRHLEWH